MFIHNQVMMVLLYEWETALVCFSRHNHTGHVGHAERCGEGGERLLDCLGSTDYDQPASSSSQQISAHNLRFSTAS